MTNPIHSSSFYQQTNDSVHPKGHAKEDLHSAEEQVASLYYQSSLTSLNPAQTAVEKTQILQVKEKKESEQSFLGKAKNWLWGIFGWGQKEPVVETAFDDIETPDDSISKDLDEGGIPVLSPPDHLDKKRLSQAITDLTRELVSMQKNMVEFEEEMRKSPSSKLDKLIFIQLFNSSIKQKKIKESLSLIAQEDLMNLHKKNQELQKKNFSLIDAIHEENKWRNILKRVNAGLTGITIGGSAIGFALGGPVGFFAVGLPLSLIGKGSTMLTDGILKYQNDAKTGELLIVRQETKANNSRLDERLNDMQISDSDIATLLKLIRHHIDNQAKAERASFNRHS